MLVIVEGIANGPINRMRLRVRKLAHKLIARLPLATRPRVYRRRLSGQQVHRKRNAVGLRPARRVGLTCIPFANNPVNLFLGNLIQRVYHLRLPSAISSLVLSVGGVMAWMSSHP